MVMISSFRRLLAAPAGQSILRQSPAHIHRSGPTRTLSSTKDPTHGLPSALLRRRPPVGGVLAALHGGGLSEGNSKTLVLDLEMVRKFAELTGDRNPIHFPAKDPRPTGPQGEDVYRGGIVHGALMASLVAGEIGSLYEGIVVVSMSLEFKRPCPVGQEVSVVVLNPEPFTGSSRVVQINGRVQDSKDPDRVFMTVSAKLVMKKKA